MGSTFTARPLSWFKKVHPDADDLYIPQEDVASVAAAATLLGVELRAPLVRTSTVWRSETTKRRSGRKSRRSKSSQTDPPSYFFCISASNFVHCLPAETHFSCV
jgi:hypothetical protein